MYETIVEIPHYDSKWLQLLDKENEQQLVTENLPSFQQMYKPIMEENFKDVMEIDSSGNFQIDSEDLASRRYLMGHLNDNVY